MTPPCVCKQCKINETRNGGGVCTPCLNGEDPVMKGVNLAAVIASHVQSCPLSAAGVARRLVLSVKRVEEIVTGHPWFTRSKGLVILTAQGRRELYRYQQRGKL